MNDLLFMIAFITLGLAISFTIAALPALVMLDFVGQVLIKIIGG